MGRDARGRDVSMVVNCRRFRVASWVNAELFVRG